MKHRTPVVSRITRVAGLLTLAAAYGIGHAQSLPRVDVLFQEKPIRVDGKLNDAAWAAATPMPLRTVEGEPIAGGAVAKLVWDREHLFLGVEMPDDVLIAGQTRRDSPLWESDDMLALFVWPDENQPYYYQIAVNPRGAFFDCFYIANATRNGAVFALPDWNPAVRAQARLNPASVYRPDKPGPSTPGGFWHLEMAIPLDSFSSRASVIPAPGEEWRAQIVRFNRPDPRPGVLDASAWSPYGVATEPYLLDRFGTIVFQGGPAPVIPPLIPKTGVSTQPTIAPAPALPAVPPSPPAEAVSPPYEPPTPDVPAKDVIPAPDAPVKDVTPAPDAPAKDVTPAPSKPAAQRVSVGFREAPLADALAILFKDTGKAFTITPAALKAAPTVTVEVQDLPFDQALTAILQVASVQHRTDVTFRVQPDGVYAVDLRAAAPPASPSIPPGQ